MANYFTERTCALAHNELIYNFFHFINQLTGSHHVTCDPASALTFILFIVFSLSLY